MTMRRALLASVALFLLVGGLPSALAAGVSSTQTIVVKGTVTGPEGIPFSGKVQIKTVVVPDLDFGAPPSVHVSIDFLDVQGLGKTTRTKYFALEEDELIRGFAATDRIDLTFAIVTEADRLKTVGTGLVSLTLTFDSVGNLTGATGSITNSPFAPNL